MKEVMAKGPNFVYAKEFIQKEYGEVVWKSLMASLSPEESAIWMGSPLVHEIYPFRIFKSLIYALSKLLGKREDSETAIMYEYIADRSLNLLYKLFFRFADPSFVIKNYPRLWIRFFDSGNVEVPLSEKSHAVLKFTLPEIFLDWIYPACLGYSKKAVEMAGGKNLTVVEKSKTILPDNSWEIVYELNWTE